MKKKIICLICARGGSKGIKNKNIKFFFKKHLIEWTFKIAKSIKIFNNIYLSSDSKKIIKIAKKYKIDVPFIRPSKLARDKTKEIYVWKHMLKFLKKTKNYPDILVVLPPTAPLRERKHVIYAINKFIKDKSDALITVKDPENNPYFNMVQVKKNNFVKIINDKKRFYRRQDAPIVFSMSTICFVLKPDFILKNKNIFDGKVSIAKFEKKYSLDIDDKFDFKIAELIKKNKV
tara:strand:+ start:6118 stop:6813 length:696 start_codon:yes stop_codon:yes gene_type:complete